MLEYADYPGPIAELELELGGLTAESGRQGGLFVDRVRRRGEGHVSLARQRRLFLARWRSLIAELAAA